MRATRIKTLTNREMAFITLEVGIVRLKVSTLASDLSVLLSESSKIAKVDVLIPPPVEPGEAPININMMIIVRVTCEKDAISSVLKPAVRGVTD